jgi:alkanesulfonate monooxygenase SsuD/methylene tetrahydromethanopterin reductase-like flavin-dependent oxidoreductase (luciferase family)
MKGNLSQELRLPQYFEQAAQMVSEDDIAKIIACGPDPEQHIAQLEQYLGAGYDHVYIHQVGPDQEGFFRFYQQEIFPRLQQARALGST